MSEPAIVLDAGVLDQVTVSREFRELVRDLVNDGWKPVIPTVVLAEAITGRPQDAPTNQTINWLGTVDTDEMLARQAGTLRHRAVASGARRRPSAVDAIVASHAIAARAGVVFTTDPDDLQRLLSDQPRIRVEKP